VSNYKTISRDFGVEAGPNWSPSVLYAASRAVFRGTFEWPQHQTASVLTPQFGLATPQQVHDDERLFVWNGSDKRRRLAMAPGGLLDEEPSREIPETVGVGP